MRKLFWTVLVAALLSPTAASALGLGEIRLDSALNERLDAEIRLLSATPQQASAMEVGLASYETFNKFGVDRPAVLMQLDFEVREDADGAYRIHITSTRPIREPFLDFILEVKWRSGRLLREYTVLLDPPELTREAPPATEAPAEEAAAPAEPAQPERTAEPAPSGETLSYGPVQEDDTLWSIAEQIRPDDSVSVPQVMMALLEANPEAFYDNNVNRLKAGAVLRLENRGLLRRMSKAEASDQLREQTRAWRDYKQRAAAEAERREPSEATAEAPAEAAADDGGQLELVAPEGESKTPSGAPAAAEETAQAESEELEKLRSELMRAQEAAEAQRSENEELRGRLEELEGQLASIQRLLTLQNEELTRLQRQLGQEPQPIEPPEQAETGDAEAPATGKEPAPAAQAEDKPEPKKPEPKPAPKQPEPKPAPKPTSGPSVTGFVSNLLDNPVVAGALALVGISVLALVGLIIRRRRGGGYQESILTGETSSMARSRQAEGAASEESSLPSDLAFSGMESIQTDESEVDPVIEADVYLSYGRNQQAEELLRRAIDQDPNRQELRVKLLETYYKTGNKDSFLAEAENVRGILEEGPQWDRVVAMGHELAPEHPLFAQAPEGGEAIPEEEEHRPAEDDVMDIGLDLDALAAEMEPSEEEAAAASEFGDFDLSFPDLEGEFGMEDEEKEKPKEQGPSGGGEADLGEEELDFGGAAQPQEETTFAGFGEQAPTEEPSPFDLGEVEEPASEAPEAEPEAPAGGAPEEETGGLEFDLGDFELPSEEPETPSAEEPAASGGDDNAMEFDLSGLDLGEEPVAEPDEKPSQPEAGGGLDFEPGGLGPAEPEQGPEPESGAGTEEDKGGLEFDLGDLEMPESGGEGDEPAAAGASEEQDSGGGMELDWDLGESGEGASTAGEAGDEEDVFAGMDDAATKLDLARAYADMGDSDAARNMLEEVLQEGTSSQQEHAQQLLDRLG